MLFDVVRVAFWILEVLIIARVFLSWFRPWQANPLFQFVYDLTEPILGPVRRLMPPVGGLDFSPLVALLLLYLVESLVLQALRGLAI
ncbi:MAG: YggT family protein [Clostridia bacterium]|nr:YggT family protein [Clostridia bacterium]MBC7346106.1 YggT family protein [Clostridia bacterium]